MREIEDNKPKVILDVTLSFYEEPSKPNTFGSNNVAYEIYYKDGIMTIMKIEAFGDRTLIGRYNDRRGRDITLGEMLENIKEMSEMTYGEFKRLLNAAKIKEE